MSKGGNPTFAIFVYWYSCLFYFIYWFIWGFISCKVFPAFVLETKQRWLILAYLIKVEKFIYSFIVEIFLFPTWSFKPIQFVNSDLSDLSSKMHYSEYPSTENEPRLLSRSTVNYDYKSQSRTMPSLARTQNLFSIFKLRCQRRYFSSIAIRTQ